MKHCLALIVLLAGTTVVASAQQDAPRVPVRATVVTYAANVLTVDGTLRALEVHIFPPGRKVAEGSHPYDRGPNSSMTNATIDTIGSTQVDKVAGRQIVLKYEGGEKTVVIPPNTPIVTYAPGDLSDLTPGAHVILFATKEPDGTLTSTNVNVGKDGLVPPM